MRSLFPLLLVFVGCAQAQRPVQFTTPARGDAAIDRVARALAAEGQPVAAVDRGTGIVQTAWQDTGFGYGELAGTRATIVRRYVVVVAPGSSESAVTVRADTQRCAQGSAEVSPMAVRGTCEAMDGLVASHQEQLDTLGARLRAACAGGAP